MTCDEIKAMKVGETRKFGAVFSLIRHRRNDYGLFDARVQERSRWGTLEEIFADVTHALESGNLPPPSGTRW